MTTTPNTTASGAADLTAEIEYNCLAAWNRSEFGANQHDTVHPMYLTAFKSGHKAALAASAPAPQPAINPRTQWLTVVYRGVEAGDEAKVICEHPKVSAMSWSHAIDDRDAALAAAPKAAPAINKVSDIIDAYGMTPGQPERVADIPGLAEALEAAFADGSAQITGATPLQQGEYPETLYEGGRETVDDALAVVESFGPGVQGLNDTFARQVLLGQEVRRLRAAYEHACQGRSDFRNLYRASHGQALRLLTQKEKDSLGRRAEGMDGNEWDQWVQEKFAQVNGLRVQGGSYEWAWE